MTRQFEENTYDCSCQIKFYERKGEGKKWCSNKLLQVKQVQAILLKFIRKLNMTILRGCTAKETPQQDAVTQL